MTLEYISRTESVFKFLDKNGSIYKVFAASESDARNKVITEYSEENVLGQKKRTKITNIKFNAKSELEATDWKVQRQREQITLGIDTSLSLEQYIELLTERQAIRDKSNELEAQINAAETIEELNGINW